jgi:glycosyltransferase involved in cell wall biosynthesis
VPRSATREGRIHHIPFAAAVHPLASSRSWRPDGFRILHVGKFEKRKNHHVIVEAMRSLPSNVSLSLVGEVSTPAHAEYVGRLRQAIAEWSLTDRISLEVNVPHSSMSQIYLEHDLYAQLSACEPASVSQLEAMAHGLGVVISRDNGTARYVHEGLNGSLCDPNPQSFLAALGPILHSRRKLAEWGRESLAIVTRSHDPDLVAGQLIRMLKT